MKGNKETKAGAQNKAKDGSIATELSYLTTTNSKDVQPRP